jgi:hypothetical protein
MDDDQYNTMIIFANYLLGMNENQTSISNSHTNNTPFVAIKMKSERKEIIKERSKLHTQKQKFKNNDLDSNQDKEICRPLMTFTRVCTQLMRKEKKCMDFKFHLTRKNLMKMVKDATRSSQQGVYSSKRQMSRLKEKTN